MGDDAGEPAVIGEQQQAFGVDVEPADRHHAGQVLGQVVEDRRAAFRVAGRGHEAARLVVEPQARALLGGQGLAVDGDPVGGGHVDGGALQHLAVEGHAALRDHRLRIAAGGDAGAGDHLGDAVLDRFLRLGLDGRALLAGAMRAFSPSSGRSGADARRRHGRGRGGRLRRGADGKACPRSLRARNGLSPPSPRRAEGLLVAALEGAASRDGCVVVAAAERLVAGLAGLARAVVVAAGAEGAFAALAGLAEGPVAGSAAAVGASWRTAPAIIVVAVGHGSLIAEERRRSER